MHRLLPALALALVTLGAAAQDAPAAMAPAPDGLCARHCRTMGRARAGGARARVVSEPAGDAPADGYRYWLLVERGADRWAVQVAEDGAACGFDRVITHAVSIESVRTVDVGGHPAVRVEWIETVDAAGGRAAVVCTVDGEPACARETD